VSSRPSFLSNSIAIAAFRLFCNRIHSTPCVSWLCHPPNAQQIEHSDCVEMGAVPCTAVARHCVVRRMLHTLCVQYTLTCSGSLIHVSVHFCHEADATKNFAVQQHHSKAAAQEQLHASKLGIIVRSEELYQLALLSLLLTYFRRSARYLLHSLAVHMARAPHQKGCPGTQQLRSP
jgi:hypothetical protein